MAPERASTTLSVLTFDAKGNQSNFSGGPFGSFVYLRADVAGKSGFGIPTGSVTFLDNTSPIVGASSLTLNSAGQLLPSPTVSSPSTPALTQSPPATAETPASTLVPVRHQLASPSSRGSCCGSEFRSTVTITAPGASGSTSVNVSSSTGFTGTIVLACSGLPAGASCQFSPSSIKATAALATTSSAITVTTSSGTAARYAAAFRSPVLGRLAHCR